eukprot:CAMPEP_0172329426 /NCGR_PEP_ID=MMETSP1058-20130122/60871_1 /TAXON_ID=83371 /ORGANISM="Detonula confervacea, Strain CCMP 353" /LENGTH=284 /DNA_ID=CAMNT_0013046597 /DNA_START=2141 /DNA_END=2995 /DNA_ORIENTATION=+
MKDSLETLEEKIYKKLPSPNADPKDIRRTCSVCGGKTDWFCPGCDSLETLEEKILEMAGNGKMPSNDLPVNESGAEEPINMDIFGMSTEPDTGVTQRTRRGPPKTPQAANMPFFTPKSSITPGKGASLQNVDQTIDNRSKKCEGSSYYKKLQSPNADPKDIRRTCSVCGGKTDWFCPGCRRYLCSKPAQTLTPKKRKKAKNGDDEIVVEQPKKLPKTFVCKVPKLNAETREAEVNDDGEPIFEEEYGEYTCYHHAHRVKWMHTTTTAHEELMKDISKKHRKSLE